MGATLSQAAAREAFNASASQSEAIFGVSGDTRYGAFIARARRAGRAINPLEFDPDDSEFGAFGYSTIPDTRLTRSIPTRGIASYSGGTAAVSGDGTLYRGSIGLQVYFAGSRVSGIVTNLADKDGEPWVYVGFPVDAILFPDARLEHDADWTGRVNQAQRAGIRYQSRFLREASVRSRFEGHLLGVGEDAASQAVGVWSVGAQNGGANYIAGGFGAQRVPDEPDAGSPPDDGQGSETGTVSRTTVTPPGTEIAEGLLTLRGTRYGPDLQTTQTEQDWNDEVQLLDAGRRIADVYQLALEEPFSRQGSERGYLGRKLVSLAREEIGHLRDQLLAVIELGDTETGLDLRAIIWEEMNGRIRARLFGSADNALRGTDYLNDATVPAGDPRKWSSGYPVSRDGGPNDSAALAAIDEMLAALASPSALRDAVQEGGGGIFTRVDGQPIRNGASEDIDAIWERAETRINLSLESTEYTRFGAWNKQTAPAAWSGYDTRLEDDENGPNAFAYSQLPQATYAERTFPTGATATYTGETVAVQGSTFYGGTLELVARWHFSLEGQDEVGTFTAVISDLESQSGDPLTYTADGGVSRRGDLGEIIFGEVGIQTDSESQLYFSDDQLQTARIRFANPHEADIPITGDPTVSSSIEGKFVGNTLLGPQGVIGIWTLRRGGDPRIGTGGRIYGAFGADLQP